LFAKQIPSFKEMRDEKMNLTSCIIQEEIIKICANQVNKQINGRIAETGFYAIVCDEAVPMT